jgi:hypothetical protein
MTTAQTATLLNGPFIAFHGDTELQAKMLEQVDKHVAFDQVVQGKYGEGSNGDFRGCFIGCTVHALGKSDDYSSVQGVFDAYGFPAPLTKICEQIFEGLPASEAPSFFKAVPNALNAGADVSLVHWKFLHWMLVDTMAKYGTPAVRKGCAKAIAVVKDLAAGKKVTSKRAYADAARAADAADAAADAARAADAAAYAARAAADAARYQEFSAKLLKLLGDAA